MSSDQNGDIAPKTDVNSPEPRTPLFFNLEMSGPNSRTPQITSQQQQAQKVPLQYQQVTSPPAIYKDDYPQQRPVYYQQLQFSAPLQTGAPSHDPSKVPQYMTSVQQAPSQQQTGPPGAPGAQGAPQGPVSQVQMYTQGRVAGAQPYTTYQPRPQSQAPRQQRPVMNTGQPQPYYGGYQVISSAPGTHYTQHPQMQVMQGQMQPTNVVMRPFSSVTNQDGYTDSNLMRTARTYPRMPMYVSTPSSGTKVHVQPQLQKKLHSVNPDSSDDRIEDIVRPAKTSGTTPPQSTAGSSRSTPNTSGQQSQIAAQFAKQVAATLDHPTDGTTTTSSSKPSSSPSSTPSKPEEAAAMETTTNSDDTAVDYMTSSTSVAESDAPTARDRESHDGTGQVTAAYAEESGQQSQIAAQFARQVAATLDHPTDGTTTTTTTSSKPDTAPKTTRNSDDTKKTVSSAESGAPTARDEESHDETERATAEYAEQERESMTSKFIQDLLECSICLDPFTRPKVLPCQHTFCYACLLGLASGELITCPQCRKPHQIPSGAGVKGFPDNFMVNSLLSMPKDTAEDASGEILNSDSKALAARSRCYDCKDTSTFSLCDHCHENVCPRCLAQHARCAGQIEDIIAELKEFEISGKEQWHYQNKDALKTLQENKRQVNEEFGKISLELEKKRRKMVNYFSMIEGLYENTEYQGEETLQGGLEVEGATAASSASTERRQPYSVANDFASSLSNSKTTSSLESLKKKVSDMRTATRLVSRGDDFRFVWNGVDIDGIARIEVGQTVIEIGGEYDTMTKNSESTAIDSGEQSCQQSQIAAQFAEQVAATLDHPTEGTTATYSKRSLQPEFKPNSGEDRSEDILGPPERSDTTPPQSTAGNSRSTANTSDQQSKIAAQFVKRVAATLDYPLGGAPTGAYPKRNLRIVDPNSGEDRTEDILDPPKASGTTPPYSMAGSSRSTPDTVETSWTKYMKETKKRLLNSEATEAEETEQLFRDIRGILNKLTPQKFNKLLDQIKALEINTEKRLCGVVNLIFEKIHNGFKWSLRNMLSEIMMTKFVSQAINEPNFSVPYALLCKTLSSISVPSETRGKPVTFRVKLLARCQHEFEKDRYDEEEMVRQQQELDAANTLKKKKKLQLSLEDYREKCKRRSTSNTRLMGELFKLKMLTEKIMHQCLAKLLDAGGEEDLECLCLLLTTIGKGIDTGDENRNNVDEYCKRMQAIIDQKNSSNRIRCLMLNVMELRRRQWVNRWPPNDPKTIDQIHKEVALENERAAIEEYQLRSNNKLCYPRGSYRGGQSTPRMAGSDDGWTTVQAKQTVDMSRMKLSSCKPTMEPDNMQLGPGFRLGPGSSWGRRSTAGLAANSPSPTTGPADIASAEIALGVDPRNRGTGRGMGGTPTGRMDRDSRGRPGQQGGPIGGGKRGPMGSRGSQESERESALAAVRHSSNYSRNDNSSRDSYRGDSRDSGYRDSGYRDSYRPDRSISGGLQPRRGSLGGSRGNSRENSRSRDGSANREYNARSRDASPREERAPAQEMGTKQMDEAAMEGKAKAILEEYLHIDDKKKALHCISELKGQKQMDVFVRECINYVLERSEGARKHTAFLLHDCIKQGLLSAESWLSGIRSVTELGEDYEIDIPKIWQYLAELIGPMMEDEIVPLKCLTSICLPIETPSKRGTLAVAVLEYISHREGHAKARLFWRKAQLKWTDFVDYEGDRLEEFIKDNKLEYTTADVEAHPDASLSFDEIQKVLEKMLKDKARDEQIFDWGEENVGEARRKDPKFIRALMTEVCKSAMIVTGQNPNVKYEKTALEPRAHVLQKYIDHEPELELQALYAIQALVHSLEHPSGLLRYFFEELSDLEILSDEAFKAWMNSTDPKEQIGFAVAKKSVNPFLSTLLADDDDDDGTDS